MRWDKLVLGMKNEVYEIPFEHLQEQASEMMAFVYQMAYKELLSRNILDLWDWGTRARNVFHDNGLRTIQDLVMLSPECVSKLLRCGFHTRKDIYEVCVSFGIVLIHWMPDGYKDGHVQYTRRAEFQDRLKVNGS